MIFHLNSESFWDSCVGRRRRGGRDQEQDESVWGEVSFHPHTFPATHRTTSLLMLHMMRTTVIMILMEPIVTSISSVSPMKSNLLKTLASSQNMLVKAMFWNEGPFVIQSVRKKHTILREVSKGAREDFLWAAPLCFSKCAAAVDYVSTVFTLSAHRTSSSTANTHQRSGSASGFKKHTSLYSALISNETGIIQKSDASNHSLVQIISFSTLDLGG